MKVWILLLVLVLVCIASGAQAVTVTVPSSWDGEHFWADTGLVLTAGSVVHVTASGSWTPWTPGGYSGPEGISFQWFDQWLNPNNLGDGSPDPAAGGTPAVTDHFGALIGYIGPSALPPSLYGNVDYATRLACISRMVLLGSDVTFTAPASGKLWLGMNDDAYSGNLSDNAGSITANVNVVPEPSSLLALASGFGILGVVIRPRRK